MLLFETVTASTAVFMPSLKPSTQAIQRFVNCAALFAFDEVQLRVCFEQTAEVFKTS